MKVNRLLVASAVLLTLMGGTGLALSDKKPSPSQNSAPNKVSEIENPINKSKPVITPPPDQSPQQIVEPQQPRPVQKTTEQLKELSRQLVIADNRCESHPNNNAVCPSAQADCFVQAMEIRYGWQGITEEFIRSKFTDLNQKYANMCPALYALKKAVPPNYPPGFKD